MRFSRLFNRVKYDFSADAEVVSHKWLDRAGFLDKRAAGVYSFTPIMTRTLRKVMAIVHEEIQREGGQEVICPIIQPREAWESSKRWQAYQAGGNSFFCTDRRGGEFILAPTAEEMVGLMGHAGVSSYKDLPFILYQQQQKFRDEFRPRFGLIRCREFMMMDAYSFDADAAGLDLSYQAMDRAYRRIFDRLGLGYVVVDADTGAIGGSASQEFMVTAETGEDELIFCAACNYGANVEKAVGRIEVFDDSAVEEQPLEVKSTPGAVNVELLSQALGIPVPRLVKTILYEAVLPGEEGTRTQLVAVMMRGDQAINEIKVSNHLGAIGLQLASEEQVKAQTGSIVGYAGPVGLPESFLLLADSTLQKMRNIEVGHNQADEHVVGANFGRDFRKPVFADFRKVQVGDGCPRCEATLTSVRGIEVGHIFKLGTKYSEAMQLLFQDKDQKLKPIFMGCYGIGSSRVIAACVEQTADEKGIRWPMAIAPFECVVVVTNPKKADLLEGGEQAYKQLQDAGIDVLLDDRKGRPGGKFKEAEIIGFPWRLTIGRDYASGQVELTERSSLETSKLPVAEAVARVIAEVRKAKLHETPA